MDRLLFGVGCLLLGLALSGVNYCQRDFDLASQTNLKDTPTPTTTPTEEPTETPDGTETPDPDATETPEPTPTATAEATATAASAAKVSDTTPLSGLLKSLEQLSEPDSASARAAMREDGDWLGKIKDQERPYEDSDGDGFADWFELDHGSDPALASKLPRLRLLSKYSPRVQRQDSDLDALSNQDEIRYGTQPRNLDTDHDNANDGAEVLSGSDPLDPKSRPKDRDGDGLSDQYEISIGSRPDAADTDQDRLRDEVELALGSDMSNPDSDNDGISDGKEFELGSDPLVKD